jgi:lysozyme
MLNGIDISDDNGLIDFAQVKGDPNGQFVYAQATEGLTVTNDTYRSNHDACKANGIPFGPYHFFYARDDGAAQAQHLLQFIDGYEGTLVPMVDVEQSSLDGFSGNADEVIRQLIAFDQTLRASLPAGKLPAIYFEYSLWTDYLNGYDGFSGHPAWPAAYNDDESLDMRGTGWSRWTLWQHSSTGAVAGISGNVDLDRCVDLATITR